MREIVRQKAERNLRVKGNFCRRLWNLMPWHVDWRWRNKKTCGEESIRNMCSRLCLENNMFNQSEMYSNREDILMKVRKARVFSVPLSNSVTQILQSVVVYERRFSLLHTITTELNKRLLICNISSFFFIKQWTTLFLWNTTIMFIKSDLAEDPELWNAVQDKDRETREIWKLLHRLEFVIINSTVFTLWIQRTLW